MNSLHSSVQGAGRGYYCLWLHVVARADTLIAQIPLRTFRTCGDKVSSPTERWEVIKDQVQTANDKPLAQKNDRVKGSEIQIICHGVQLTQLVETGKCLP